MKTINYFGHPVTVPDYAKYIATDDNGEMWWYTNKPSDAYSMWIVGKDGNCGRVSVVLNIRNWRGSLRKC